jgi:plastocyanin
MKDPHRSVLSPGRALGLALFVAFLTALTAGACGGGGSSPSNPSTPGTNPPAGGNLTVTISATGVSPRSLDVPMGGRVTFVNSDTRSHQIMSDPNPLHNDCPAINEIATIGPGQTRQTGSLDVRRTCGYHDHMNPGEATLRGALMIGGSTDPVTPY